MQPELTLNTKCPACGTLKPKTLAAIKAQTVFDCDCGFHAELQHAAQVNTHQAINRGKQKATTTA